MRRRSVGTLTLAALLGFGGAVAAVEAPTEQAELIGSYAWKMDDPLFGGMSAIDFQPDGLGFIAVSDRGSIVAGQFRRDAEGRISGIDAGPIERLRGRDKAPLPGPRSDSEGLAVAPDGTIYVSFEMAPRVLRYGSLHGPATILPIPRDFNRMSPNGSLESLAIGPDGALYTLPEVTFRQDGKTPVYRFLNGIWDQPVLLDRDGALLPVGADFGPDGMFYLLERDFGLRGFSARVRRFDVTDGVFGPSETLLETAPGTHGNLEGLSVWQDEAGRIRLTMIADNNFYSFLQTQVVEYMLKD